MLRLLVVGVLGFAIGGCAAVPTDRDVAASIKRAMVSAEPGDRAFGKLDRALCSARVVGLGEATHGQHEAFELKRALTMHLIRSCGVRLVAYEAASSRARVCDDYINGRSDDLDLAMGGLGMQIWMIQENAALLNDLRRWNAGATPEQRVRFVGVDVQDPQAAARRLVELLGTGHEELARRAMEIPEAIEPAVKVLWGGDPAEFHRVAALARGVREDVDRAGLGPEAKIRAAELEWGIQMHHSPGGRDRAMAEMLREELRLAGRESRAVLWAHNEHIKRGKLTYMNSDDLAMGGCLAAAMQEADEGSYYALGFVFAQGAFNALAQDEQGKWRFKEYRVTARAKDALADPFLAAGATNVLVDLRSLPQTGEVGAWLNSEHAHVWFGGYRVPDDLDSDITAGNSMLASVPVRDYDGLAFLHTTTASRPFIWKK